MRYNALSKRNCCSALAFVSVLGTAVYAAGPEAGSVIGNQAVATYTNSSGDQITVTSNKVETVVQQIAGVSMTSDNNEAIAPGGKAFLPHVVTNDGNGPDSFDLVAAEQGTGTLNTTLVFYPDANLDGVADSATPITSTPVLAPGEQFGFIIEATADSTQTGNDTIAVTATSVLDGTIVATNTDTLTISTGAIVEVVKSMTVDASGGASSTLVDIGDEVTITLTYSSTGLAAADNYLVTDALDGRLDYVPGSARWSDSGPATQLNDNNDPAIDPDATNGGGKQIFWDWDDGQNVQFRVSDVPSGRSGKVTFRAVINDTADAGIIPNTAKQSVDGTAFPDSNTATVAVDEKFTVEIDDTAINPDGTRNTAVVSATDTDNHPTVPYNDIVADNVDVFQGATIPFEFVISNTSNQTDSYTLDVNNVDFPAGTTFRMVGADGATPIVGSVGPLASGDSIKVTLLATLPTDVPPVTTSEYTATVRTISDSNGAFDNSNAEFTGQVLPAAVDLENQDPTAAGDLANPRQPDNSPWLTYSTDPGAPVTFPMKVENNGPTSDSYNLSLNTPLPLGWTVEFKLDDGTLVSNTGTISAGASKTFNVVVTPPEGTPPSNHDVDIKVASSVSGQADRIVNQVTINEVIDIGIVADQSTQAGPGGVVDMIHTVTNFSNIAINEGDILQSGLSNFSGAIYWDANDNGVIDATEGVIDNFNDLTDGVAPGSNGIAAGDSISLIYRVQTPSTATAGVTEVATLSLGQTLNANTKTDTNDTNQSVEDRIVIVSGDVTLQKFQYVDATCNDNAGTGGTFTKVRQDVEPGQCIRYLIEAENTGTANAGNVRIRDVAPAYTVMHTCSGACDYEVFPAEPSSSVTMTGTSIDSQHNTVVPGAFARIEFTVKVNQ
ncbi:NEW3 domain-containing protein [Profundibacterium mesophilum]|uniref:Alpha-galactosidase NEW3 domain-containing protein n=1 Tax=Profundibacterium mesophilum KAUST100406-0324 TaxID=1037889 RepID=A0A921NVM6_9RHOB|nr:NEW3 domain-containing protein [Profundibacterium mesophilum]KAF0676151.1 hypothetical protein PMES_01470 [Profundibacterium mesophilum KAUST100406-0324]